jgi:ABC-type multidrug transport system permease subunit
MKTYHPLKELFLARLRTFYREPEAIFWTYGFPLILAVGLGIAFRSRPQEQVVVDVSDGPRAAEVLAALGDEEQFDANICAPDECPDRLRLGKTTIVVEAGDAEGSVTYRFDPMRPESQLARIAVDAALQRDAGRTDPLSSNDVEITEPGARYIDFLIPGLIGMNLLGGGLWGVGFVITDMRVKRLLRRLLATPMRRSDFMLSLIGGRLVFMFPEVLVLLGAGWLLFGMPIRGSVAAVLVLAFIGAFSFAGLGLLVASRAEKIETIAGLTNLVSLPMWLFSGVFFSWERFPEAFQPLIFALPLTQLNNALRNVILEGESLFSQGLEMSIVMAWGAVSFLLALKWFRWT